MDARLDPALRVAESLLQIKAVKLSPNKPFTWASGWKSPIYCDNRKTLSYPAVRTYLRQQFVHIINHEFGRPDMIAGVATGGIAHGVLVAHDLGLPFIYVRSTPKEHGMKNQVEGDLTVGRSVVVVEDLVSTGQSSLNAVQALREAGCEVKGMVSIFTYGFDEARKAFEQARVKLVSLTDYPILLDQALHSNYITEKDLLSLNEWRRDPANWKQTATPRMTRIESKQVEIAKPAAQVDAFLQDMNNFQQLLPQDRISEWKSDGASCSFKVQGAATIGLKLDGGIPGKEVRMVSTERSPFKFRLTVHLEDKGASTRAWQVFEADLNPFIKMMVESPLKHLFDHIADKMVALHGAA